MNYYSIVIAALVYLIGNVSAQPGVPGPLLPLGGLAAPVITPYMPPVIPPFFGLGLGFGFPFFGGFGLGRFGLGRFFGKRDVDSQVVEHPLKCILESSLTQTFLNCTDSVHTVSCQAERHLTGFEDVEVEIPNVDVNSTTVNGTEVCQLLSREANSEYTFIHPVTKEKVIFSAYSSDNVTEPGFLFKDKQCVRDIKSLVKDMKDSLKFSLIVRP
jgi:hypothetical protein